jgi:DNA-binding transcriptional LysR family regulator
MKSGMKPREMQLLWEVNRTGSVTTAADRVAMTQPAASAMLRGLEERLGFALFERTKRRLSFTVKGRALLPEIANTLAAMDSLGRLAESLRTDSQDRVVIGSVATVAATLLPHGVQQLRKRLPHAQISVRTAMSLEIESMVAEGRVDFGLVVREGQPTAPGCVRIAELPLYCVLQPSHPLAQERCVEIAQIAKQPYVSLGRQFNVGGVAARMLAATGGRYAPAVEVMNFSTACAFVKQGGYIAVLDALARMYAPDLGLVALPISGATQLQVDLVWSPLTGMGVHAEEFAAALTKAFDQAPALPE